MCASLQSPLFSLHNPVFPTTRYQGSKAKLVDWIWSSISSLNFHTFLDAFGGTGVVGYKAKLNGKCVTYNDLLKFNYHFGVGLIENNNVVLSPDDLEWIFNWHSTVSYKSIIQDNFCDIYFTNDENQWLDKTIANIYKLENRYKFSLAFFALCQSCIVKRPYNLFHRKNLYLRFADVKRSFGNKTSWDRPFEEWFSRFVMEANQAVFDNGFKNIASNYDALNIPGEFDLVYLDTPYISKAGIGVDYRDFYHFLEGLTNYYSWENFIDWNSKHRRLMQNYSEWNDKFAIASSFEQIVNRFKNSIIVVSYRSDGIPSEDDLVNIVKQYKSSVRVLHFGQYTYALSKNNNSKEILIIGE